VSQCPLSHDPVAWNVKTKKLKKSYNVKINDGIFVDFGENWIRFLTHVIEQEYNTTSFCGFFLSHHEKTSFTCAMSIFNAA
jgi:hypothetical protein